MTDYDELAQLVVALGYGIKTKMTAGHHSWWVYSYNQTAEQFCNDGRTVLAMMEKLTGLELIEVMKAAILESFQGTDSDFPLAVAILTACCDALED